MPTIVQWVHVTAAVIGVGGIAFLSLVLLPSTQVLGPEERDRVMKSVGRRFRWLSWSVIALLILSGLYNIKLHYWHVAWGTSWLFLTIKIVLAFGVFAIAFALTLPLSLFDRIRERRQKWLRVALGLGLVVILISAYLRQG